MIKVDMHCHSTHSKHPSEWFLQRLGTQESYTAVEDVYRLAKSRGMDFVTLCDHNAIDGALELVRQHPDDCFISDEITTYFPENGCKIHVLAHAITPGQFEQIQHWRHNIYELREMLRSEHVVCSVAHATFSINGKLDLQTIERLILLFDVFEGINGGRSRTSNMAWVQVLQQLTPNTIDRLNQKHGIEPWGAQSWIKGFTAGSDDHAGLFIGDTYTTCDARSLREFLGRVQAKEGLIEGRHGDYKTVALALYKIAHDCYRQKTGGQDDGMWSLLPAFMFGDGRLGLRQWLVVQKLRLSVDERGRILSRFFDRLAEARGAGAESTEVQIDKLYAGLAALGDEFFSNVATGIERELGGANPGKVLQNLAAALPVGFLAAPFITTMRQLHKDRDLVARLPEINGEPAAPSGPRRALWFSDTVLDLNGVSVTMRALAHCAHATGRPMRLVTSVPDAEVSALPLGTLNLPCIYALTPAFYPAFTLRVPSLLRALDLLSRENPDEVIVSTPGPVGLVGLMLARLLGVKCVGVYHTDFTRQVDAFIGDQHVSAIVEQYTRLFFRQMDELRVPTPAYMTMLSERGLDRSRMRPFNRGIEPGFVVDDLAAQAELRSRHGLDAGPVLLWVGRVGKEKNLDFLMAVVERVARRRPEVQLLMVGDGPDLERLREEAGGNPRRVFAGRVPRENLPHYYGLADVFVFPSTTDTFGMVVLEAQACGLPAIVTDIGGPQDIVQGGTTGYVLGADDSEAWAATVLRILDMRLRDPRAFGNWRQRIREQFRRSVGWEGLLDEMLGGQPQARAPDTRRTAPAVTAREPLPA